MTVQRPRRHRQKVEFTATQTFQTRLERRYGLDDQIQIDSSDRVRKLRQRFGHQTMWVVERSDFESIFHSVHLGGGARNVPSLAAARLLI